MKEQKRFVVLVNAVGSMAYFCVLLAWVLFVGVILLFVTEKKVPADVPASPMELPGFVAAVAGPVSFGVAALMVIVAVVVVAIFPYLVGKFGSQALKGLLSFSEIIVTNRSLFFAKLIAVVLPVVGFIMLSLIFKPHDETLRMVALGAYMLAVIAAVLFIVQLVVARRLHVTVSRLW